jgi:outer membrane protein assembly factor BamD
VPAGTADPDKFLFDKGTEALERKKWLTAREFFKQVTETYTQSPYRPDAKLGIGDTYLGEGTAEALVLAMNEFREFLSFYPTNRRADYAQYKLGMAHFRQMRAPQRDQTETRETIKEFEAFIARYPDSSLMPEVKAKYRGARDRLSESDYLVGYFYFRQRWYPGAIDRLRSLLQSDPEYTGRDAVFYYLAEALSRTKKEAEALPLLERLVEEFEESEYLALAHKRIEELKTQVLAKPTGG